MKIIINIDKSLNDTEIVINCGELTSETEQIITAIRLLDKKLSVIKDDESYILDVSKILYIESVDRKTFVYTSNDCYETKLKLYEIEERLCNCGFLRTGKACLVNLKYISSLKSDINRKLRLTLENGEQLIVSRQYADALKIRLGVK
ncbi:MAG: LytTR family transcriptional regulator DNA-binding domain-containing protein [Oscillospiraceae bacterium]|nr:LytTR family transcriptional regulator DNA-binding domain-containing protein [Oscillospiraceae bacterium]